MKAEKKRVPLSQRIYEQLLDDILCGKLPPGSRLVELKLTSALGVSRTPLRETFFRLEKEGLVVSDSERGFSVAPLSSTEVRQIYPIISALEVLAIKEGGLVIRTIIPELEKINHELERSRKSKIKARVLDTSWHEKLVSCSTNMLLLKLIKQNRSIIRRYEEIYMRDSELITHSVRQHADIISALEQGDLQKAAEALELNWRFGMESLLLRLERNSSGRNSP